MALHPVSPSGASTISEVRVYIRSRSIRTVKSPSPSTRISDAC